MKKIGRGKKRLRKEGKGKRDGGKKRKGGKRGRFSFPIFGKKGHILKIS